MRFRLLMWTATLVVTFTGRAMTQTTMPTEDLVAISRDVPGAAEMVFWNKDGTFTPATLDADKGLTAPPGGAEAIGVVWPIRHVVDCVQLESARPVAASGLVLKAWDGLRWAKVADGLKIEQVDGGASISFDPLATQRIRVEIGGGLAGLKRLQVRRWMPSGKKWPDDMVSGDLEKKIRAGGEASFERLAMHSLSMPSWATMGLKDFGQEQGVNAIGQIYCRSALITALAGDPQQSAADVRDTFRRSLLDGYLPGIVAQWRAGPLEITQTTCTAAVGPLPGGAAMFIRVEARNASDTAYKERLTLRTANFSKKSAPPEWSFDAGVLRNKAGFALAAIGQCKAGEANGSIDFQLNIAPGKVQQVDLVVPLADLSAKNVAKLQQVRFEDALAAMRDYWRKLLAPAGTIDLPEQRLNNLYKAVLTQFFMNGHGNLMPYGSLPGAYDGSTYGVEEGYIMLALAMSGLGDDARRYMDGTYLTEAFLAKVDEHKTYADRHQQYRNGLQPMYAVEVYRLCRDRKWIERHLPLIKQCAEWTIANRRKTMQLEDGKKPLHWGLLPKWSYGGDLADVMCYPLYANFACWRGLKETAWLLGQLGDAEGAAKYAREASDYQTDILRTVDAIYMGDAKPPFLPPHVYATTPAGQEYYQLFAGCIMDLLPFKFADRRADYLGNFLQQDNRLFCQLPRFRRDVGAGGMDAIYGLGHILTLLHQDRIEEFLTGFYAFQAFNMEHTCFTSRESTVIYASDVHLRTAYPVPDVSDPLPASSAVALLLLRNMLVSEESQGAGDYTGNLRLLAGAPRQWLEDGKTIALAEMPTHFGKVACRATSHTAQGLIQAEVTAPEGGATCGSILLRLRHPQGARIKTVQVNGRDHTDFDAAKEWIELKSPSGTYKIEAKY